jgi:hypothetical protein
MAVLAFGAFLYVARGLLVPIMAALMVSLTLGPIAARSKRFGRSGLGVRRAARGTVNRCGLCRRPVAGGAGVRPDRPLAGNRRDHPEKFRFMDRPLIALRELQMAIAGSSGLSIDTEKGSVLGSVMATLPSFALQFVLFPGDAPFLLVRSQCHAPIFGQSVRHAGRPAARTAHRQ